MGRGKNWQGHKKLCKRCGLYKTRKCFAKNRSRSFGIQATCKKCFNSIYRKKDPKKLRESYLKRDYGLSWDDYIDLYNQSFGMCVICNKFLGILGEKDRKIGAHVDHCHKTGAIRGILCHSCNAGLGYFNDDVTILFNAIHYIKRGGQNYAKCV